MSVRKSEGKKESTKKPNVGGGSKSKAAKAKTESRKTGGKGGHSGAGGAAEIEMKKTRTRAARQKTRRLDIEPLITSEEIEDQEYSPDEMQRMMSMYEGTLQDIKEGEVINGTVLGVTRDDVIVDVGFKSEGIIPIAEFPEPINIKVGEKIQVYLDAIEDSDGQLVLSKMKADFMRVWDRIKECHDSGQTVQGRIVRRIKGGMVVDLFSVEAFLPGSQIALRQVPDTVVMIS